MDVGISAGFITLVGSNVDVQERKILVVFVWNENSS
jgi:hypothetical protein